MNELIKITEHDGKQAVSARELHAFLESKTRFNDWITRRIEEYELVKNQDYEVLLNFEKNPSGGRPLTEYALTIDAAKELSMVEGNEKGKQARRYFIWCEKQKKELERKNQLDFSDPDTVLMLVQNWKEERQKRLEAESVAERQAPKVKYYDDVLSSDNLMSITEIAKSYGWSGVALNGILHGAGVQHKSGKRWTISAKYQSGDYVRLVPSFSRSVNGREVVISEMKWTEAGRKLIHELLVEKKLINRQKRLSL